MRWEVDAIEDWDVRRRVKAGDVSGFTNCEVACVGCCDWFGGISW